MSRASTGGGEPWLRPLAGAALLAAGSWIEFPMQPVPMTLQSLVVVLLGAAWGWRGALAAIALWLGAGALGAPVFAGGTGGLARFQGSTAGYLFAFPVAAVAVALMTERSGRSLAASFAILLAGHAICLLGGGAWLATSIGAEAALTNGVMPFLPGALVKSAAGALLLTCSDAAPRHAPVGLHDGARLPRDLPARRLC